jgi:transcriptional regulator with XRE-family HTH domain
MKERLIEFLRSENKSSAQLAEEIGVQASGISHILSGRNNPSLDFVLKMLLKYPLLSTDWLLFGKGSMYKEGQMQNLFDFGAETGQENTNKESSSQNYSPIADSKDIIKRKAAGDSYSDAHKSIPEVVKIVWFYDNNSFEEYYPRN